MLRHRVLAGDGNAMHACALALCILLILIISPFRSISAAQEGQLNLRKILESLGYQMVSDKAGPESEEKHKVNLELRSKGIVQVVESKIQLVPIELRSVEDPWIRFGTDFKVRFGQTKNKQFRFPLRMHGIVFDSDGKEVDRIDSYPMINAVDTPSVTGAMGVSCGLQLQRPLESGVAVWIMLARDSENSPWRVVEFTATRLSHIE